MKLVFLKTLIDPSNIDSELLFVRAFVTHNTVIQTSSYFGAHVTENVESHQLRGQNQSGLTCTSIIWNPMP